MQRNAEGVSWALKRVLRTLQLGSRGGREETMEDWAQGGVCLRELGTGLLSSESV